MRDKAHIPCIQTFTGIQFPFLDPKPEHIALEDIAHALSLTCRFSGHVSTFYSVAEHCVRVSRETAPEQALYGLLHDAAEAYLTDIPTPIKHRLWPTYQTMEAQVMTAICERFGLPINQPAEVTRADGVLLVTEARDLLYGDAWKSWGMPYTPQDAPIIPLKWREAKDAYLFRFKELVNGLS